MVKRVLLEVMVVLWIIVYRRVLVLIYLYICMLAAYMSNVI
jgi:hypothetical protein